MNKKFKTVLICGVLLILFYAQITGNLIHFNKPDKNFVEDSSRNVIEDKNAPELIQQTVDDSDNYDSDNNQLQDKVVQPKDDY